MIDEEKAEEYIRENVCNKERVWGSQSVCSDERIRECNECGNFCYFARINRESYLAGLAKGRKEGYEQGKNNERKLQCGKKNYEKDIARLEKENAELKASLEEKVSFYNKQGLEKISEIERLEKENEELKDNMERLKPLVCEHKADITSCYDDITRLTNENEELKEQVKKMKCCRNCLYENNDEELVKEMKNNQCPCTDCKKLNYKNWRLYK